MPRPHDAQREKVVSAGAPCAPYPKSTAMPGWHTASGECSVRRRLHHPTRRRTSVHVGRGAGLDAHAVQRRSRSARGGTDGVLATERSERTRRASRHHTVLEHGGCIAERAHGAQGIRRAGGLRDRDTRHHASTRRPDRSEDPRRPRARTLDGGSSRHDHAERRARSRGACCVYGAARRAGVQMRSARADCARSPSRGASGTATRTSDAGRRWAVRVKSRRRTRRELRHRVESRMRERWRNGAVPSGGRRGGQGPTMRWLAADGAVAKGRRCGA
jgi:hypothetical protein